MKESETCAGKRGSRSSASDCGQNFVVTSEIGLGAPIGKDFVGTTREKDAVSMYGSARID